jgi:hypothetical protein
MRASLFKRLVEERRGQMGAEPAASGTRQNGSG